MDTRSTIPEYLTITDGILLKIYWNCQSTATSVSVLYQSVLQLLDCDDILSSIKRVTIAPFNDDELQIEASLALPVAEQNRESSMSNPPSPTKTHACSGGPCDVELEDFRADQLALVVVIGKLIQKMRRITEF